MDTSMTVTINKGDTIKYFWAGKVTVVEVEADFKAKVVGCDEASGVIRFEYADSPNGRAWTVTK